MVHEGEVTFERQLPGNISASAAYVVSRGLHLPIFVDANLAPPPPPRAYDILRPAAPPSRPSPRRSTPSGIDPTGVILVGYSDVNSWYNSMVLTFRRPMRHGLEFLANYTLSKAFDGGQVPGQYGTFNGTDSPIDPYNRKLEYALGSRPAPPLRGQRRLDAAHRRHLQPARTCW